MYSFARIVVEHFRVDSVLNIHGIPVAQLVSLIIITFASISLVVLSKKNENS